MERTRGAHARFEFLKNVYTYKLQREEQAIGDDEQVGIHRAHVMRAYMLYFVGTVIFMDFEDFEWIHEYNGGDACLIYLYSKLSKGFRWKMKQVTCNITLLTIIFIGILMFLCHFHFIFTMLLLMIRVFQTFQAWILQHFFHISGWAGVPTYTKDMSRATAFALLRGNQMTDSFRVYLDRLVAEEIHFKSYITHRKT